MTRLEGGGRRAQDREERDNAMVELLSRPDARKAHPTFEHLLPIHVGVEHRGRTKVKDYGR